MFKKRVASLLAVSIIVCSIVACGEQKQDAVNSTVESQKTEQAVDSKTNLFAYAVRLDDSEYAFAPAQVAYGMTKEEMFKATDFTEADIPSSDSEIVVKQETLKNVTENIDEVEFLRKVLFSEGLGVWGVEYWFQLSEEDLSEFCRMLYLQAKVYMPDVNDTLLEIRDGNDVVWTQSIAKENGSPMQKSTCELSFAPVDGEKGQMLVVLKCGISAEYLKVLAEK